MFINIITHKISLVFSMFYYQSFKLHVTYKSSFSQYLNKMWPTKIIGYRKKDATKIDDYGSENTIIVKRPELQLKSLNSSKIKQIHFWHFWEKQVSLMEFIHMSMGKQNLEEKKKKYLRELSGSKFHSVYTCKCTSSNVTLYNDVKNSIFIKSGFIWFWNWALQLGIHPIIHRHAKHVYTCNGCYKFVSKIL